MCLGIFVGVSGDASLWRNSQRWAILATIRDRCSSVSRLHLTAAEISSGIQAQHGGKSLVGLLSLEILLKATPSLAGTIVERPRQRRRAAKRLGYFCHHRHPQGRNVLDPNTYRDIAVSSLLVGL